MIKMSRKTIEVENVRAMGNASLDSIADRNIKAGVSIMLESILMETGNYKGFRWLPHVDAEKITVDDKDYYDRYYF